MTTTTTTTLVLMSLDLECTGLGVNTAEVTQIGLALQLLDIPTTTTTDLPPFCKYVQPRQTTPFHSRVVELTGITQKTLRDANAQPFQHVLQEMLEHVATAITADYSDTVRVLLSYNGNRYDIPIFVAEIVRAGLDPVVVFRDLTITYNCDLLPMGRQCLDETTLKRTAKGTCSYKLGDVYQSLLGCKLQGAHDALQDANGVLSCIHHSQFLTAFTTDVQRTEDFLFCSNPMTLVMSCAASYGKYVLDREVQEQNHQPTLIDMMTPKKKRKRNKNTSTKKKKRKTTLTAHANDSGRPAEAVSSGSAAPSHAGLPQELETFPLGSPCTVGLSPPI
jgi:hypothetical protein